MIKLRIGAIVCIVFVFSFAKAQQWEVGANLGGAGYIGDLNPINPVKISGVNLGAYVKRNFDGYLGVSLHYNYGSIKANDATSANAQFRDRNLSFNTDLHELNVQVQFNFFEYMVGIRPRRFSPYLFVGGGIVFYDPQAEFNGDDYKLRNYATEGQTEPYKKFAASVPYGFGIRYNINETLNFFSQIGYRTAFTDYLDDVSGYYPYPTIPARSPTSIALSDRSGEQTGIYIGNPGTQRGDFRKRDTYMFVGIGISYTFVSSKCFY